MRETQGEAVSATELFNNLFTCLQNAAVAQLHTRQGNGFLGSIVESHHGTKPREERLEQQLIAGTSKEPSFDILV